MSGIGFPAHRRARGVSHRMVNVSGKPARLGGIVLFVVQLHAGRSDVSAQSRIGIEFLTGLAFNFPTTLRIDPDAGPPIQLNPTFESRSFEVPIHWVLRGSVNGTTAGWELQLMHHKLRTSCSRPRHKGSPRGFQRTSSGAPSARRTCRSICSRAWDTSSDRRPRQLKAAASFLTPSTGSHPRSTRSTRRSRPSKDPKSPSACAR